MPESAAPGEVVVKKFSKENTAVGGSGKVEQEMLSLAFV